MPTDATHHNTRQHVEQQGRGHSCADLDNLLRLLSEMRGSVQLELDRGCPFRLRVSGMSTMAEGTLGRLMTRVKQWAENWSDGRPVRPAAEMVRLESGRSALANLKTLMAKLPNTELMRLGFSWEECLRLRRLESDVQAALEAR